MSQKDNKKDEKEYDFYRDSLLRYAGYANEVGEAFRPLVKPVVVHTSYLVATAYVFADTIDKSAKEHRRGAGGGQVAIKAGDVFIWQMLASVFIPGFTINRITTLTRQLVRPGCSPSTLKRWLPTAVGLAAIPIIIHPIDKFVDYLMDDTYRKYIK